jgi:hypothetical protein
MNRSKSKIRHIQESNLILEKRVLSEKNMLSKIFGKKEDKELSDDDIESQIKSMAASEFGFYRDYKDDKRKKFKDLVHPDSSENEIHVDLSNFDKGDTFYKFIEPVKEYLKKNDNEIELGKYKFKLHGNKIVIKK